MFEPASALAAALAAGGRDGADGRRSLRLAEMRGLELVQLGVFAGCERAFAAAVEPLLGLTLPESGAHPVQASNPRVGWVRAYRIARDQYWICSRNGALGAQLAGAIPPEVGTATGLSNGRVRIALEGAMAGTALATLLPIDLHPAVFRVGDCAQTGMHHVGVLLERTGAGRYEIIVLRTFAQDIWELLADAALQHGYDTEVEGQ